MDMDTFLTTLYVVVDDCYQRYGDWYRAGVHRGAAAQLSDSEVMTIALAGMWRAGTPWQSERGVVRWMLVHGRGYFPKMIKRSGFNKRVKQLWGLFVMLQQGLAAQLSEGQADGYEATDCLPVPAYSNGQALREPAHALWDSGKGHGGTQGGWYYGHKLLLGVHDSGAVTGFVTAPAHIQDRWLLEALLAYRAGYEAGSQPPDNQHQAHRDRPAAPPPEVFSPSLTAGSALTDLMLADKGFNASRWAQHWLQRYQTEVITVPPYNSPDYRAWSPGAATLLAGLRQVVETVNSVLTQVFPIQHLGARSPWGRLTRLSVTLAAFNLGLWLNRALHRPAFALQTLLT